MASAFLNILVVCMVACILIQQTFGLTSHGRYKRGDKSSAKEKEKERMRQQGLTNYGPERDPEAMGETQRCGWGSVKACSEGLQRVVGIDDGILSISVENSTELMRICREFWSFEACFLPMRDTCEPDLLSVYGPAESALKYMCGGALKYLQRQVHCMQFERFVLENHQCYKNYSEEYVRWVHDRASLSFRVTEECRLTEEYMYCYHMALRHSCGAHFTRIMLNVLRRLHGPQFGGLCGKRGRSTKSRMRDFVFARVDETLGAPYTGRSATGTEEDMVEDEFNMYAEATPAKQATSGTIGTWMQPKRLAFTSALAICVALLFV